MLHCCAQIRERWYVAQLEQRIRDKMTDHKVSDFVTKKSYQAVTLVSKYPVKVTLDAARVDPLLLFQQLITVGRDVLKYELCVYPPALFEATGTMLQSDEASQANTIQEWVQPSSTQIHQDVSYILEGGALIHKMPWKTANLWGNSHLKWKKSFGSNPSYSQEAT